MPSLHDCHNAVLRAAKTAKPGALLQYAAAYARTGLRYPDAFEREDVTPDALVQARYVLANLSGWRGTEARAVKQALRAFTKIGRGQ